MDTGVVMKIRNPIYTKNNLIDCEIEHPALGWIPFTANPNDVEELGRVIFAEAKDIAAPFVPQDPAELLDMARATASMSRAQFADKSAGAGWVTEVEAIAWAGGNAIPDFVDAAIAKLPKGKNKRSIRINVMAQPVVRRTDLLIPVLMKVKRVSPEQMDAFFGIEP